METPDSRLVNGIRLQENGLRIITARLLQGDGTALPPDPVIGLSEIIYCQLFITGWKAEHGLVRPGASEVVRTAGGEVVTSDEDLFRDVPGATEQEAGVVTLRAGITSRNNPARDFEVRFRIWDKASGAAVSGAFTFHLR